MISSRILKLVPAGTAVLIAAATLWPLPSAPQPGEVFCLICGPLGGVDFLWNIVLFAPLGLALVASGTRVGTAGWMAALFSIAIEACQWRIIPGRDASAGDVLANTGGALLGAMLARHARALLRPPAHRIGGLAFAAAFGFMVLMFGGAWVLRPAAPTLRYWSQWTPVRGGYQPFSGSIRELALFGRPIPNGMMIDPASWRGEYLSGRVSVTAVVATAGATPGVALIARAGNPLGEQFQLAQRGVDLVVRGRANAARLGLRSPSFVLPGGVPPDSAPRTLRAQVTPGQVWLSSEGAGDTVHVAYRVGVGMAWLTATPIEVALRRTIPVFGTLWVAMLFLPVAYWSRQARPSLQVLLPGAAAVAGVVAAPRMLGIAPSGPAELAGLALGFAIGALAVRQVMRVTGPRRVEGAGDS